MGQYKLMRPKILSCPNSNAACTRELAVEGYCKTRKTHNLLLLLLAFFAADSAYVIGCLDGDPLTKILTDLVLPPANEALVEIPDPGRKLLAFRSYVRAGPKLVDRWSWTEEEIKAFQGSAEQQALVVAVEAVKTHFAQANPGYEIYANTKVRSLDVQIMKWNSNESVGTAAREILSAWKDKFGTDAHNPGDLDLEKIRAWLYDFNRTHRAKIAAPGLTRHGRANAIDFQVMQDGKIIAGTDSRQTGKVWRMEKWDVKLKESILASGSPFSGPLVSPNEPWHYDYHPAADT
jgi:hypothetical protein